MSNRRKLRAKAKPKSKRGTVTPEEHESLARVRGALSQNVRRGLVDKSGWAPGEHGAAGIRTSVFSWMPGRPALAPGSCGYRCRRAGNAPACSSTNGR